MVGYVFCFFFGAMCVMFWNAMTGPEYEDRGEDIPPEREKALRVIIDDLMQVVRAAEKFNETKDPDDYLALCEVLGVEP